MKSMPDWDTWKTLRVSSSALAFVCALSWKFILLHEYGLLQRRNVNGKQSLRNHRSQSSFTKMVWLATHEDGLLSYWNICTHLFHNFIFFLNHPRKKKSSIFFVWRFVFEKIHFLIIDQRAYAWTRPIISRKLFYNNCCENRSNVWNRIFPRDVLFLTWKFQTLKVLENLYLWTINILNNNI